MNHIGDEETHRVVRIVQNSLDQLVKLDFIAATLIKGLKASFEVRNGCSPRGFVPRSTSDARSSLQAATEEFLYFFQV